MCGIDWQHEVSEGHPDGPQVYGNIKNLKQERTCWEQCGIIEVEIKEVRWHVKQTL